MNNTDSFFRAVCNDVGQPEPSQGILDLLNEWARWENTRAAYNPLATTRNAAGATQFNDAGVRNYPSMEVGIAATANTFLNGLYPEIVMAIRGNDATWQHSAAIAAEIRTWGTMGFASFVAGGGIPTGNYLAPSLPGGAEIAPAPAPAPPPAPPPPPAPDGGCTYAVVSGDTLAAIASRYGLSWPNLWNLGTNRQTIPDPNLIYPGQEIDVPCNKPTHGGNVYVVKPGDTLSEIAATYHLTWTALWNLTAHNRETIRDPNLIYPGQEIDVP